MISSVFELHTKQDSSVRVHFTSTGDKVYGPVPDGKGQSTAAVEPLIKDTQKGHTLKFQVVYAAFFACSTLKWEDSKKYSAGPVFLEAIKTQCTFLVHKIIFVLQT